MNQEILEKYITSLLPMPIEKAKLIIGQFESIELQKSEFILEENKISKDTYILASGFVRSYTFDNDGNEVTTNI